MENQSVNQELSGSNRLVTLSMTIESIIVVIAYLVEFLKHDASALDSFLTIVLCLALPISCWAAYKKKSDTGIIKHIIGIGFPIFYTFVLFTTTNTLTFSYAAPILIIASAYADSKYSLKESVGFTLVNVGQIIFFFSKGIYNSSNIAYAEIHIFIVLLIATFSYFSVRRVEINNREREARINDEMNKTKEILEKIVAISRETNDNIDAVCVDINELGESIKTTSEAMRDVDEGATNTTETVHVQMEHTQNISEKIDSVSNNYHEIVDNISESLATIREGKITISELAAKSSETIDKGNAVNEKLNNLDAIMSNMNSAVDIISEITTQTGLLSLNASIEAARAGEAGRGFAVVAMEISKMSNDTQDAANRIQKMVEDVTAAISEVVDVTSEMISQIMDQAKTTEDTVSNFEKIEKNTDAIKKCASEMSDAVDELDGANREIVESISTISTISGELSLNANDTLNSCEDNIQTVEKIIAAMNKLSELASSLTA